MSNKNPFILLLISIIFLISCDNSLVDKESEMVLEKISESQKVKVYGKGSDTYVDVHESKIDSKDEMKIFYTVIAKSAFELANKQRTIYDTNGECIVRFISSRDSLIASYSINNRKLSQSQKVYNSLYNVINDVLFKDTASLRNLYDSSTLSNSAISTEINSLFDRVKVDSASDVNTHGFQFRDDFVTVYVTIANENETNSFKFIFNSKNYKFFGLENNE